MKIKVKLLCGGGGYYIGQSGFAYLLLGHITVLTVGVTFIHPGDDVVTAVDELEQRRSKFPVS